MRRIAAALSLVMVAGTLHAETGRTGASTLNRTYSATIGGLGGAAVALPGRLDGTFINPASAATMPSPEIQATYLRGFEDDSLGGIRYGHTFGFGGVFVGGDYFDAGTIDINLSDGTEGQRRAQQDGVGVLGFALGRRVPFSLGASAKFYRLELAEEATASGVAFDLGAQWITPLKGLSVGVAGTNIGSDVEYESEADPLPTAARFGVAYNLEFSTLKKMRELPYGLTVTVDGVGERHEDTGVRAGLEIRRYIDDELSKAGAVALRGGYQNEPRTATAGLGVRFGGFGIDYAFGIVDDLDNTHRATVSWRFLSQADKFVLGGEISPPKKR